MKLTSGRCGRSVIYDQPWRWVGQNDHRLHPHRQDARRRSGRRTEPRRIFLSPLLGCKNSKIEQHRGYQSHYAILEDRSPKRAVFEIDSTGQPSPARQIRSDRYYAAHLLGDLRDVRAVPILIPLLKDEDVKVIVPWSLAEIGDKSAIPPLKEALADKDLTMRASTLRAIETLERDRPD
jgi:HEAT repeats